MMSHKRNHKAPKTLSFLHMQDHPLRFARVQPLRTALLAGDEKRKRKRKSRGVETGPRRTDRKIAGRGLDTRRVGRVLGSVISSPEARCAVLQSTDVEVHKLWLFAKQFVC